MVSYVLDCVPCQGAAVLGAKADLLVHESTYEHARKELAHERGHSTGVEAAQIARDAQADMVLLTHFSPSVDPESVADEARAVHPCVLAASDLVAIDIGPIEQAPFAAVDTTPAG